MSWRRAIPWLLVFALLAGFGGGALDGVGKGSLLPGGGGEEGERRDARVERIVDGDTIKVRLGGRRETVRYIGVDTPETRKPGSPVECYGRAASAQNARLVEGRRVTLEWDVERRDRYGRLLAYVRRSDDDVFVNARMVQGGYATTATFPPNVRHERTFRRLQREAREAGRGLWRACR
jgi:micrococcal nuclease